MKPFTVLLMLPDYWRSDQSCAADEIIRVWVSAPTVEMAIGAAMIQLPSEMPDEEVVAEDFAPIAVYPDHLFDLYQS